MVDLELVHVSKRYWVSRMTVPRGAMWRRLFARREAFWALRDATFTVPSGATVGVIGANGAGKSTVLKLLSGITAPTEGEIRLHGRLAALIEVGSGFHPELTGRENVFLSGAILGMRPTEIARSFDRIVDFAGVGDFIDVPVKWYSSGMYVRLGFAVAAHVDAQILLVDEVLAVGDEAFQHRCYRRIAELRDAGTTVVFISHDLATVERLCNRVMLLRKGRIVFDGDAHTAVAEYRRSVAAAGPPDPVSTDGIVAGSRVAFQPDSGGAPRTGYPLQTTVTLQLEKPLHDAVVELTYCTHGGNVLYCQQTTALSDSGLNLPAGTSLIRFDTTELGLQPGVYTTCIRVLSRADAHVIYVAHPLDPLLVEEGRMVSGYFYMPHTWRVCTPDRARDFVDRGVA
jgi:homopolymeric O-antigen transport system ATP-binding protein